MVNKRQTNGFSTSPTPFKPYNRGNVFFVIFFEHTRLSNEDHWCRARSTNRGGTRGQDRHLGTNNFCRRSPHHKRAQQAIPFGRVINYTWTYKWTRQLYGGVGYPVMAVTVFRAVRWKIVIYNPGQDHAFRPATRSGCPRRAAGRVPSKRLANDTRAVSPFF